MSSDTSRPIGKLISHLPNEVLLTIFKLTCLISQKPAEEERDLVFASPSLLPEITGDYQTMWDPEEDLLAPGLFPYTPAAVCTSWRDLLASVPAFWTRLFIAIDSDSEGTSVADIKAHLTWSANLPLNVTLARRSREEDATHDPEEQARVREILEFVKPHFHRLRSLHVNVFRSTSLPIIGIQISGSFPLLITLTLECEAEDRDPAVFSKDLEAPHVEFLRPCVRSLTLDGFNFMRMRQIYEDWTAELVPELQYLTIAFAHPPDSPENDDQSEPDDDDDSQPEPIDFHPFLEQLTHLTSLQFLHLANLPFGLGAEAHFPYDFPSSLETLVFDTLSCEILSELFRSFRASAFAVQTLKITNCFINELLDFSMPDAPALIFANLREDADIKRKLAMWYGSSLTIEGCPSFDDGVLQMLGEKPPLSGGCLQMVALGLQDCENFSVSALKRMVEAREKRMNKTGFGGIVVLGVSGTGPEIGEDDLAWFESHVPNFIYDVGVAGED